MVEVLALANGDELDDVGGHGADPTTRSRAHRALLALAALFVAACAPGPEDSATPPRGPSRAQLGEEWFNVYCASCHGLSATGDGPVTASLRTRPPDLTSIAARNGGRFDADAVAAYIDGRNRVGAHGPSEMPVWGRPLPDRFGRPETEEPLLARDVISLITEYLRSIQSEKSARLDTP